MTYDILDKTTSESDKKITNNQSFFLVDCFRNNDIKLIDANLNKKLIRCETCGLPLETLGDSRVTKRAIKKSKQEIAKTNHFKACFICKREKILNAVLIASYVLSTGLFIAGIVGVFLGQVGLDLTLMIGCLEIIFLLFFGRFLEEAVFFGLSRSEKIFAALYRFSISAEIQAYDVAMKYIRKNTPIDSEILMGLLQVITYQSINLPTNWFVVMSRRLNVSSRTFIEMLSNEIDNSIEDTYIRDIIQKAPPSGISILAELFLMTNNKYGYEILNQRLELEFTKESLQKEWLNEFYINNHHYRRILFKINKADVYQKISESLLNFQEPKIPTSDMIASGKNIVQRTPFLRYLIRIFLYILLAFLLGLLYRLFD